MHMEPKFNLIKFSKMVNCTNTSAEHKIHILLESTAFILQILNMVNINEIEIKYRQCHGKSHELTFLSKFS